MSTVITYNRNNPLKGHIDFFSAQQHPFLDPSMRHLHYVTHHPVAYNEWQISESITVIDYWTVLNITMSEDMMDLFMINKCKKVKWNLITGVSKRLFLPWFDQRNCKQGMKYTWAQIQLSDFIMWFTHLSSKVVLGMEGETYQIYRQLQASELFEQQRPAVIWEIKIHCSEWNNSCWVEDGQGEDEDLI